MGCGDSKTGTERKAYNKAMWNIMKTVKRETDPAILDKLCPMFVGDGEFTPEFLVAELKTRMIFDNNSVCIIVGYDKEEIIGFLVCVELKDRHYLWLEQAYNKSGYSTMSDYGMRRLLKWASETGKKEMRFETSPECPPDFIVHKMAKRRGFKEHSTIYAARF